MCEDMCSSSPHQLSIPIFSSPSPHPTLHPLIQLSFTTSNSSSPHPTLHPQNPTLHSQTQLFIPSSNTPSSHQHSYPTSALQPHISSPSPHQLSISSSNSPSPHPTPHPHISSSSPDPTLHPYIISPSPHQLSIPTSALHPHIQLPTHIHRWKEVPTSPGPMGITGCHIHEHVQLMGKNHSSTFGPYLCFQEHLFVLPTQTHPCLVHVGSSDAPLPPVSCLLCIEDASAQVWDVIVI